MPAYLHLDPYADQPAIDGFGSSISNENICGILDEVDATDIQEMRRELADATIRLQERIWKEHGKSIVPNLTWVEQANPFRFSNVLTL